MNTINVKKSFWLPLLQVHIKPNNNVIACSISAAHHWYDRKSYKHFLGPTQPNELPKKQVNNSSFQTYFSILILKYSKSLLHHTTLISITHFIQFLPENKLHGKDVKSSLSTKQLEQSKMQNVCSNILKKNYNVKKYVSFKGLLIHEYLLALYIMPSVVYIHYPTKFSCSIKTINYPKRTGNVHLI